MGLTKSHILLQYSINGLNLIGMFVSVYALIVEMYKDAYPEYKPFCDISEAISCSKALMSEYGKGFGIVGPLLGDDHALNLRNPIFGIAFYMLMCFLTWFNSVIFAKILYWLAAIANVGSIYLAYVMYFHIKSLCVVCCSLYVVNFILLLLAHRRVSVVKQMSRKKRD